LVDSSSRVTGVRLSSWIDVRPLSGCWIKEGIGEVRLEVGDGRWRRRKGGWMIGLGRWVGNLEGVCDKCKIRGFVIKIYNYNRIERQTSFPFLSPLLILHPLQYILIFYLI
jgi:hypothetical protein